MNEIRNSTRSLTEAHLDSATVAGKDDPSPGVDRSGHNENCFHPRPLPIRCDEAAARRVGWGEAERTTS